MVVWTIRGRFHPLLSTRITPYYSNRESQAISTHQQRLFHIITVTSKAPAHIKSNSSTRINLGRPWKVQENRGWNERALNFCSSWTAASTGCHGRRLAGWTGVGAAPRRRRHDWRGLAPEMPSGMWNRGSSKLHGLPLRCATDVADLRSTNLPTTGHRRRLVCASDEKRQ